jgi:hypothetical protein
MRTGRIGACAALCAALLLAACDWGTSVDLSNQSGNTVAEQIRQIASEDGFAKPGRWETTITLRKVDATGMPEAALANIRAGVGKAQTAATCLKPEDIRRGAFYVGEENAACRYDRFSMGHGRIQGSLRCVDPNGTRAMTMSGSYGPDRYELLVSTDAQSNQPQGAGKASVTMAMNAKRTGECLGTEEKLPPGMR